MRNSTYITALVAGLLATYVAGCTGEDGFEPFDTSQCDTSAGNVSVAGTWTLRGNIVRTGCPSELQNDDNISFESLAIVVQQDGTTGELTITPPANLPNNVTFTVKNGSTVQGDCALMTLLETDNTPGAFSQTEWQFSGTLDGPGLVQGKVEVVGPGTCSANGTFTATIN